MRIDCQPFLALELVSSGASESPRKTKHLPDDEQDDPCNCDNYDIRQHESHEGAYASILLIFLGEGHDQCEVSIQGSYRIHGTVADSIGSQYSFWTNVKAHEQRDKDRRKDRPLGNCACHDQIKQEDDEYKPDDQRKRTETRVFQRIADL